MVLGGGSVQRYVCRDLRGRNASIFSGRWSLAEERDQRDGAQRVVLLPLSTGMRLHSQLLTAPVARVRASFI